MGVLIVTIAIEPAPRTVRSLFTATRVEVARRMLGFFRRPLGWVIVIALLGGNAWYGHLREGNRLACAATSVTLDTQTFREIVAGGLGGGAAFERACRGLALPGPIWARMRTTRNWAQ